MMGFSLGPLGLAQGFGTWGAGGGGQNFYFLNMVMQHIKLKGMNSSPGYTEKFYPIIILVTLGWGQRVNYHSIFLIAWGFAMAPHRMCPSFKSGLSPFVELCPFKGS